MVPYRTLTVAAIIGLSLFVALAFFAAPQLDDFCFGSLWAAKGFEGGVAHYYATLTGRVTAIALMLLTFELQRGLELDIFAMYQLTSIALMTLFVWLAIWTARRLWPSMRGWPGLFGGLALAFAMIAGARSVRDLLYWHSASLTYSVSSIVTMLVFVSLYTGAARRTAPSWAWGAFLTGSTFLAALGNEFTGAMIVIVTLGSLVVRLRHRDMPTASALHGALIAAAVIGFIILALAPGNALRLAMFGHRPDLLASLFHGPVRFIAYLGLRVDNYGVIGWLVLAALHTRVHDRAAAPGPTPVAILVWSAVAVFVLCGIAAFTAGYYGMQSALPARSQNQVYLVGFVALTFASVEGSRLYGDRVAIWIQQRTPWLTAGRAVAGALALMAVSLGVLRGAHALVFDAAEFRAAVEARVATLEAAPAGSVVAVPAIEPRPKILFVADIDADPKHWANQCLATFYGVRQAELRPQRQ